MPVAAKTAYLSDQYPFHILRKFHKIFEEEKLIKIKLTRLFQIFSEIIIDSKVIFRSV